MKMLLCCLNFNESLNKIVIQNVKMGLYKQVREVQVVSSFA